jgi:hypothetical protein
MVGNGGDVTYEYFTSGDEGCEDHWTDTYQQLLLPTPSRFSVARCPEEGRPNLQDEQGTWGPYTHDAKTVRFTASCTDTLPVNDGTYTISVTADLGATCKLATGCGGGSDNVFRPDGRIRVGTKGAWIGDNVYETGPTTQLVAATSRPGRIVRVAISIQNDGVANDSFKVRATGKRAGGYAVRYFAGPTEVTGAVAAGTFLTPVLTPGKAYVLTAQITPKPSASKGSQVKHTVSVTSKSDGVTKDVVGFAVKRR